MPLINQTIFQRNSPWTGRTGLKGHVVPIIFSLRDNAEIGNFGVEFVDAAHDDSLLFGIYWWERIPW